VRHARSVSARSAMTPGLRLSASASGARGGGGGWKREDGASGVGGRWISGSVPGGGAVWTERPGPSASAAPADGFSGLRTSGRERDAERDART
jgi:hypothetical protein